MAAGRKSLRPGELDTVTILKAGRRFRARGYTRDAGGALRRPTFTADTEQQARDGLAQKVAKLALSPTSIRTDSTLGELLEIWLAECDGVVRPQTLRVYRSTARSLTKRAGGLTLDELTPARVRAILRAVRDERPSASDSAMHAARAALNGAIGSAVEEGVIDYNPLLSLRKGKRKKPKPIALRTATVVALSAAIRRREERVRRYTGKYAASLRLVVTVQLGSGLRLSEVLGLRHMDVDLEKGIIDVNGTLTDDMEWRVIRQDELKADGQERRIILPRFATEALAEARTTFCTTIHSRRPDAPAIPSMNGTWLSPRNLRRSFRDLRNDEQLAAALSAAGITIEQLKPHVLRKTAATHVAADDGDLDGAMALLGHSNVNITRQSYIGSEYRTVGSAVALDRLLGEALA